MVGVTIGGVTLRVGDGVLPVAVTVIVIDVAVTVGVAPPFGARERAIKPTQ